MASSEYEYEYENSAYFEVNPYVDLPTVCRLLYFSFYVTLLEFLGIIMQLISLTGALFKSDCCKITSFRKRFEGE